MINFVAKSLVLAHTLLSVAAMSWAIMLVIDPVDLGWKEPIRETLEREPDTIPGLILGNVKSSVRYASEYDKSQASLNEAKNSRDLAYTYVTPALDQIRDNEGYLANNHLHYRAELRRLQEGSGDLEVKGLREGGFALDTPNSNLGKPAQEDKPIANLKKSYRAYGEDFKMLLEKEKEVDVEMQVQSVKTKAITALTTGTDEANKKIQPGLYDLIDMEFKAQTKLKDEIDDIKPRWSNALENARLYQSQRQGLEQTLEKLKKNATPPVQPTPKLEKKVV